MSLIERPDDPEQVALVALKALRELSDLSEEPAQTEVVLTATTAITHALLEVASAIRDAATP